MDAPWLLHETEHVFASAMRRTGLAMAGTIVALFGWAGAGYAETKLTVVADEWPPFSGKTLKNGGISLDVISAVLIRAGYDVSTEVLPWARIMDGSRKGEYDIVGSLFFDEEIATYMTYGEPFFSTDIKFVRKKGAAHTVSDLDSLRPYTIAVGDGFLYEENFDRADFLQKVVVTTTLQAVQMVAYDRVDLTLDSEDVVKYAVQFGDPSLADRIEVMPNILTSHDIHMAVRNTLPEKDKVIADFNNALADMRADGSLAAVLSAHDID
ncbi:ABC transporter substrate-binding protein [Actibacterium sp. 188UL27-1]|uniref:substrate-binding periplasmic protein n=1 Tax=Actibacterium sp. 188UL27-1 TaxID=2786961 RepID=UPI00195C67C7|nr:transporter substrate-binding domain-containing protein [Actibacterium sp. 188UL27-1]MBM7068421.1 transporter substrate-binding domain-containing protein [Actibacterium sp. 188UL27-1]